MLTMPRVLSLKKAQQAAPPKNQKAITQFFKHTNASASQQLQNLPIESQVSRKINEEKKSVKRKAESAVCVETIEILDEPGASSDEVGKSPVMNLLHIPKKFKDDDQITNKDKIQNKSAKKSPLKENGLNLRCSPRKPNKNIELSLSFETDESKPSNKAKDVESGMINRSPLTPVKEVNIKEENGSYYRLSNNINEYPKSCPADNHNLHKKEKTIESPMKVLQLENDVCNKSRCTDHLNHVEIIKKGDITPKKVLPVQNCDLNRKSSPGKGNKTLNSKSPIQELRRSPRIAKLLTPEKIPKHEQSPSKCGSTVKALDFDQNGVEDMFRDEWEVEDVDEECEEDLDLSTMQRCELVCVTRHPGRLELKLKNTANNRGTCFVEGIWLDTPLCPGEVISVLATKDASGSYHVGNTSGLLALRPDHLMSCTSVVAGVFCKRKAVLQERWRGIDSANNAMTMGILIHELVQKALTENIMDMTNLRIEADKILKESIQMLYDAGLTLEEARTNMQVYISPLAEFMQMYIGFNLSTDKQAQKDQWRGHIDKVLDIEENMCCPQLGLKGKIDATLQVTIHERKGRERAIVPLELKSGKASVSAEHRGQLVLYGMMLSLQRGEEPTRALQRGLLLYLKERVELKEVSCGYPERRDLVMLRNQLVQHLAVGPEDVDTEQLTDIEDASCLLQQKLPEPVHHQTACARCPYLTICSLHLWHTDGPSVSETHPLAKLREQALGHLSADHIKYFLRWTALLKMEERGQMKASPLHSLWTDGVEKRSKRGTCAANLKIKSVQPSGDRFMHIFERPNKGNSQSDLSRGKGPQEGDFSIVSIENRPWIAAGVVSVSNETEINIFLERDISRRLPNSTNFHIDTYESYASTVQNLTNLGVLLEDSDRALRLRQIIIDKEKPQFEKKMAREVGRLGTKLMRSLNIEQQRAVLKALAAKDYALLQGLPGTGKTQTISILIQMLVGLKQRVLVSAHTHSAVDTVLSRLPGTLRVMRLGSSSRVAACLANRCEQKLIASCETPDQLEQLYDSMEVVGVTCLGAAHAMLTKTTFDVCIVDEATQVLQSTVLRPLLAAKRFVLVGDPDQLPPVVRSRAARRLGMEESLFHRLMNEDATSTLQLQYRMNQALADIANRVAYKSRLKCADQTVAQARLDIDMQRLSSQAPWLVNACSPEPEHAALFLNVTSFEPAEDSNKSCANTEEACVVIALVDALIVGGVKPSSIGVIAPYRDQVSLLRRVLTKRGAEASTVDQFQGRDKAVIVFSCTKRAGQDHKIKEGEILNDQRRLAVSVTRAKHKLIVVGNSCALKRYVPLQRLIEALTPVPLDTEIVKTLVIKYQTDFAR